MKIDWGVLSKISIILTILAFAVWALTTVMSYPEGWALTAKSLLPLVIMGLGVLWCYHILKRRMEKSYEVTGDRTKKPEVVVLEGGEAELKRELWLIMQRLKSLFDFADSHSFVSVSSKAGMDLEKERFFDLANWFWFFREQFQGSADLQRMTSYFFGLVLRQTEQIYASFHKRYQEGVTKEQKDLVRDYNGVVEDLRAWLVKASEVIQTKGMTAEYIEETKNW